METLKASGWSYMKRAKQSKINCFQALFYAYRWNEPPFFSAVGVNVPEVSVQLRPSLHRWPVLMASPRRPQKCVLCPHCTFFHPLREQWIHQKLREPTCGWWCPGLSDSSQSKWIVVVKQTNSKHTVGLIENQGWKVSWVAHPQSTWGMNGS